MRQALLATTFVLAYAAPSRSAVAWAQDAPAPGEGASCEPSACLDEVALIRQNAREWSRAAPSSDDQCVRDELGALERMQRRATVELREYREARERCGSTEDTECNLAALNRTRNLQQLVERARASDEQMRACQPTQARSRTMRILGYSMVIGGGLLLVPLGVTTYLRDGYLTDVRTCDAAPSACAGVADRIDSYNSLGVAIPIILVLSGLLVGTGSALLLQSE